MDHLAPENQDIILRIEKTCWRTRFNYNKVRRVGGLSSGWKYFAVDNNLEEFDVCLFVPGAPIGDTFVLNVTIFRVVQELALFTGVVSPTSKAGKRKLAS